MQLRKSLLLAFVLSSLSSLPAAAGEAPEGLRIPSLEGEHLASLVKANEGRGFEDFRAFLQEVAPALESKEDSRDVLKYITGLKPSGEPLSLYRLLGAYTRIKHQELLVSLLGELVAIPTDKKPDLPQHHNPEIIRFGERIEKAAKEFGLEYRNVDNRIFEVNLPGSTPEYLGIYTHGDVVPANPEEWGIEGTKLEPYKLTRVGDLLYGRGTEDDKCSIVAALVAMRSIRESGLPLKRGIRLIIETTEETSGEGVEYYKERNPLPPYNLVLDSGYPLVTAEKGFGSIRAYFPVRESKGPGAEIIEMRGAQAINQIPAQAAIFLRAPDLHALKSQVDAEAAKFAASEGVNEGSRFRIETRIVENYVDVRLHGVSAHSSGPDSGLNPVSRALVFAHRLAGALKLKPNAYTDAARFAAENFGIEHLGRTLGIAYEDAFMGPLTAVVTYLELKDGKLQVGVNLRNPRGKTPAALKTEIERKLADYKAAAAKDKSPIAFDLEVDISDFMVRDAEGNWLRSLLDTYGKVTGRPAKPISSAGSTTAKQLPNGVNFGPAHPGEKYMGHNANEFKKLPNFLLDAQMFTEAFLRLGNLEKME